MKLLGSTKNKIIKDENGESFRIHLEIMCTKFQHEISSFVSLIKLMSIFLQIIYENISSLSLIGFVLRCPITILFEYLTSRFPNFDGYKQPIQLYKIYIVIYI